MRLSYGFDNECQNVSLEYLSLGTFVMGKLFRCNLFLFPGKNFETNEHVAIKVESLESAAPLLNKEFHFYRMMWRHSLISKLKLEKFGYFLLKIINSFLPQLEYQRFTILERVAKSITHWPWSCWGPALKIFLSCVVGNFHWKLSLRLRFRR